LPDGFFSNQKSQFGQILEGLRWENVDIFMAVGNILLPLGIFYDHLVHVVLVWYIYSAGASGKTHVHIHICTYTYIHIGTYIPGQPEFPPNLGTKRSPPSWPQESMPPLEKDQIYFPGVEVMITIFGDFCQFSAKIHIGVFLENQCYDPIFA
jgi:hypothetical protein